VVAEAKQFVVLARGVIASSMIAVAIKWRKHKGCRWSLPRKVNAHVLVPYILSSSFSLHYTTRGTRCAALAVVVAVAAQRRRPEVVVVVAVAIRGASIAVVVVVAVAIRGASIAVVVVVAVAVQRRRLAVVVVVARGVVSACIRAAVAVNVGVGCKSSSSCGRRNCSGCANFNT